jgi:succinoglycan biosynthesis transport protein ExoP
MEPSTMTMDDYFRIVKRRKWSLILPAVFIFSTAAIVALALPSIYKSTATILIEEQDIPVDYVKASVTSYAEERLQSIQQRITSSSRLLDMINKFNLYPELKERWTSEKIVSKMRDDIILEPISSDVIDRRTGRPSEVTIAFTLSYEGKSPQVVHRIANTLATMFLEENLRVREKQVTETSDFLEQEMRRVKAVLTELDAKMAVFKKAHINELPDLLQVNMQSYNNIENIIDRLNEQLRSLKEREGYLQTQLASIPRGVDQNRLAELKAQLAHISARYTDKHPDVIKTKTEIAEFEKQRNNPTQSSVQTDIPPDNPAYITLASQLSSTQADIVSVKKQIQEANETATKYSIRIANTPNVEEAYKSILIERNNTQAKYDDLMRKHMEAQVAQGLEKEQKGERFTLVDPARLPEKSDKPNRLAIMLIGMVLGIGAGVGWASFREFTDPSIRDSESLVMATSFPVLASIPEILTEEDIQRKKKNQRFIIIALILGVVASVVAFHFLVMDLNVFWEKLMGKISF